ncbi:hypothetical protein [Candidatus Amarobacter glycogenicus]|uniref:hypothetical protein n=1 Tax=Candidatus Amarobacter glycogenicus TaxID=3140699 RepID=UPI002A0B41CC|nr:hypothetical protein [Dehalococcoidia bacterium]
MDKDLFVLLLIVVIRGCAPLLILRWQFAGGLLCILADTSDSILQDALGAEPLAGHYHLVDKSFDIYYLAFECGVALWRWTDPLARGAAAALFALRAAGVVFFELTGFRGTFLFAPNVFENFYLFVAGMRSVDPGFRIPSWRWLVMTIVAVGAPKLLQEYVMHYRESATWHFVKENILMWR